MKLSWYLQLHTLILQQITANANNYVQIEVYQGLNGTNMISLIPNSTNVC